MRVGGREKKGDLGREEICDDAFLFRWKAKKGYGDTHQPRRVKYLMFQDIFRLDPIHTILVGPFGEAALRSIYT